jgi:proline iminopeptidase
MNTTVTLNGVPLNVHTQGEGPAIYAHHGAPGLGTHATPAKAFKPLADTHRVVTFDARGSGRSGAIPPYTHAQWVDDWARLMDHHGDDRVILTGGSYGGYIAQEFALAHPDRVSHLILRDTAASHRFEAQAKRTALAQASRFPGITEALLDMLFEGRVPSDEAFRDAFMTIAPLYDAKLDESAVRERFKSAIFRAETHNQAFSQNVPNFDLTGRLHEIQVPTLVVVGRHDWITPVEASEEIAAGIPNSELVIFENSGHSPQLEESDRFVATVRSFLARHA